MRSVCETLEVLDNLDNVGVTECSSSFTLCGLFLRLFLLVSGIFSLLIEVFWCPRAGTNSTAGINGCRRAIWLVLSSWRRCGPICRQHQGRDGSIVEASEVRVRFSGFSWHSSCQKARCLPICKPPSKALKWAPVLVGLSRLYLHHYINLQYIIYSPSLVSLYKLCTLTVVSCLRVLWSDSENVACRELNHADA